MKLFGKSEKEITKIISTGNVTIAVYGLGKMGLPLAVVYAKNGFNVIGVDVNKKVVDLINSGKSHLINEPGVDDDTISKLLHAGKLKATTDGINAAKKSDVMVIIVPSLIDDEKNLKLDYVFSAAESIGKGLKKGDLVITECTLPPGTTAGPIREILENNSGLKAGLDFGLAHSPERTMSGQVIKNIVEDYPKIVGGIDKKSTEAVAAIYSKIAKKGVIKVSNSTTAEAIKVFEGVYRDVNIALANELALLAERIGVNVIEAINGANSQPYSHIHLPGAGVGGHCIPIYPYFLINLAHKYNLNLILTYNGRKINELMPYHIVDLVIDSLNELERPVKNSKIGILGVAYKGGVKSTYLTPAKPIIEKLKQMGAKLLVHDPLFSPEEIKDEFDVAGTSEIAEVFKDADCVIIITNHKEYNERTLLPLLQLMKNKAAIVDGRYVLRKDSVVSSGKTYRAVGITK
ncbi:MAG: nucleotide sugar dehydrogenase [Candidatus Asgardarchaeia archaeon]